MPPPVEAPPFDVAGVDLSARVADLEGIRAVNPHRHEFELLTAVVLLDPVRHLVVGFKDLGPDEFWTRGHFPGGPIMPGVLMCEAAAQLGNFYTISQKVVGPGVLMGLGGIDEARFYRPVRPGERLVIAAEGLRVHRRMTKFRATGFVNGERAFEAVVIGAPIGRLGDSAGA